MSRRTATLALAVAAKAWSATDLTWSQNGSTYSLGPLTRTGAQQPYNVTDSRVGSTIYNFNIFATVPVPAWSGACARHNASGTSPRYAWQIQGAGDCYYIGGNETNGWTYAFADPVYPNRGVVITYPGGEDTWCAPQKRELAVLVQCSLADPVGESYSVVDVREESPCVYRVTLPSIAGCPMECQTGTSLCSNHGVCGYNSDAVRSQCFCFNGFSDPMCGTKNQAEGLSVEGVLLIIVCIVLAGVLALVGFMFLKLRRLQVDPAAYDELQGRFNELGQLA